MLRVFIGVDKRQPVAYTVCRSSIERRAKKRVIIEPIKLEWTPITRCGLTEFTFARYAAPWLCGYEGISVFMDADVIVQDDINELAELAQERCPVSVVKAPLRFEWPSVMVFRNYLCKSLTPEYINDPSTSPQKLSWSNPIGELPGEWNFCVGYDKPLQNYPKLIHYTQGIPCWPETQGCEYSEVWHEEHQHANGSVSFQELMGRSVHAQHVYKRLACAQ